MKRIIYVLTLGLVFSLSACEDVEVGYLESNNAGYAIDTLFLYNVKERLAEYKEYEAKFNEKAAPINEQLKEKEVGLDDKRGEIDYIDEQLDPIYDAIEAGTATEEMLAERDRLESGRKEILDAIHMLEDEIWYLKQDLARIAQELGFDSAAQLTDGVAKLENTIKYNIPWHTSPIGGILGTQPMSYSIGEVKNENPENAELFRQSLSIMGGGIMFVALDVKAPEGSYIVSIVIENEGQRVVLEDAFTFIVGEQDETEGENS